MARVRELRDRIFAGLGAALFLGSACALTFFVIWQGNQNGPNASQAAQTAQSSQQQNKCTDTQTEATLKAPAVYKPSGKVDKLQTTDLVKGTGQTAKSGDCLVVKYYGTLASNGKKFDENFTSPSAFAFTLGQGQVIPGWDEGLVGMKVGGERRLVIPASLAYGSQAQGSIPANSALVFVVKLLRIQ